MCDPVTAGMMIAGVASSASNMFGKKGGGGGGIPTPSMPGLQLSPVTGVGGPSGTTPASGGGAAGGPQPAAGGNILGTGMGTDQMGGLLGKMLGSLGMRSPSVIPKGELPMAAPAGFNPLTG